MRPEAINNIRLCKDLPKTTETVMREIKNLKFLVRGSFFLLHYFSIDAYSFVQASFVLQNGFSDNLNEQVANLTQFEGKSVSIEESSSMKDVMSALLWVIAPHIQESPDYRIPFAVNCSIFFYTQIEKIICDVAFENIEEIAGSCASDRQFPVSYLEQLQKNHILQTHTVVGLAPVQHPQSLYWLYFKLPPTPTASVSQMLTESVSESPSSTETIVASATKSLTQSETLSQNRSISPSESFSLSGSLTIPPTTGLLAAWNAAGGVYADATNQSNRYTVSNGVVTDTLTQIQWEQTAGTDTMVWSLVASYCSGRTTGGRSGWRVPNIVELNMMYDYTLGRPNTTVFPGTTTVSFWSASPEIGNGGGNAWDLELAARRTYYTMNSTAEAVRCVIACYPIPSAERYVNASGEVTDLVTGLIWQQVSDSSAFNQTSAVTHCTGLGLNNHTWRLPRLGNCKRSLITTPAMAL